MTFAARGVVPSSIPSLARALSPSLFTTSPRRTTTYAARFVLVPSSSKENSVDKSNPLPLKVQSSQVRSGQVRDRPAFPFRSNHTATTSTTTLYCVPLQLLRLLAAPHRLFKPRPSLSLIFFTTTTTNNNATNHRSNTNVTQRTPFKFRSHSRASTTQPKSLTLREEEEEEGRIERTNEDKRLFTALTLDVR